MSEHEELQTLLEEGGSSKGREARFGSPYMRPDRGTVQWVVEGNDTFCGTGPTTKELPSGMYKLSCDERGVVHFIKAPIVTDKLIDLKDTASDEIINGIRKFWASEEKYRKIEMIYKRGVLLWGPAGSGKTVTVTLLMRELVDNGGIVLFCQIPDVVVTALTILRRVEPERRLIVVLEDIEEIIDNFGEHTMLALLDGEHQVGNVVNIATTNYPERLGARIINRPSRFDHIKKIDMPNDESRREYFEKTLPTPLAAKELDRWVADTKGMSIAHLRELVAAVSCLDENYEETIKRLKAMSSKKSSSSEFKRDVGMAPTKRPNGVQVGPSIANPLGL